LAAAGTWFGAGALVVAIGWSGTGLEEVHIATAIATTNAQTKMLKLNFMTEKRRQFTLFG
jgi:hypothetical protein